MSKLPGEGKPPWHLVPMDAVEEVARVFGFGAEKYGVRNWEQGINYSEIISAQYRHSKKFFQDNQDFDEESNLLQTAHIACNALILLAYQLRGIQGIDDRPNRGLPPPPHMDNRRDK